MNITEIRHDNYVTLVPEGELDANSSILMDEKIQELIEEGHYNLHVDCSKLDYISSAGLGVFIAFLDTLKEKGGTFVFSGMSDNIRKVFELLGLQQVFKITAESGAVEEAFRS